MGHRFSLTLFSTRPDIIHRAIAAGVDEIIVDWEWRGKQARQASADTEINRDTADDLSRVRACTAARVLCRLNACGETTRDEIECAIHAGADEILLPMVRSAGEVATVLDQVGSRCKVGILVETIDAVRCRFDLGELPLSRVYVGLNDLAIERGTPCIFTAIADGTVERIRQAFRVPFGFGGLTLPERGHPIPCCLLIGEMARLDCAFSFLRRSFYRDIEGLDMNDHVPRILAAYRQALSRSEEAVRRDRQDLEAAISAWPRSAPDRGGACSWGSWAHAS